MNSSFFFTAGPGHGGGMNEHFTNGVVPILLLVPVLILFPQLTDGRANQRASRPGGENTHEKRTGGSHRNKKFSAQLFS